MKTIAVAGGGGGVGSTIVDGLIECGKYRVLVLSRSARSIQNERIYLNVDYSDVQGMAETFTKNSVNVVICAMGVVTESANEAQKNLIRAAELSQCTERFVISSFDMLHREEDIAVSPLARFTFEAIEALEKSQLIYTRIVNGWFLDYYGMPARKSHLEPWTNILNMSSKWAVIPGDPNGRASFLTSEDMSRYLARLMDLAEWPKIIAIRGNTFTFAELVTFAEKVRGCKFRIAIDSVEKLRSGKISFFPDYPAIGHGEGDEAFYAMIHSFAATGRYVVPEDLYCLDTVFQEIQVTTPMQVMKAGWEAD